MFYNIRRDTGKPVKRISYSSFVPLIDNILPEKDAKEMIRRYMLNKDVMLAPYGIRSLSKQDPDYNNAAIIVPYSNWQGPIWINANYMNYISLKRYGFNQEAVELADTLGRWWWPTSGNGDRCTRITTPKPVWGWRLRRSSRKTMFSPASSAGTCWRRTCCNARCKANASSCGSLPIDRKKGARPGLASLHTEGVEAATNPGQSWWE